jgi:methylmalonyl-CoA mutase cobalamin-binding subunit
MTFLYQAGAVGVFGPGTPLITDSANKVLNALEG